MQNHSEIAEFLWKIADLIKDDFDAKDYENVILPFTLLRRLDCVLEANRGQVREAAAKYGAQPANTRDMLLTKASGQRFYNTSEYSLAELTKYPNDLGQNFWAYLAGSPPMSKTFSITFRAGKKKGSARFTKPCCASGCCCKSPRLSRRHRSTLIPWITMVWARSSNT